MLSNNSPGRLIGLRLISCCVTWPWLAVVALPSRSVREAVTTISLASFAAFALGVSVDLSAAGGVVASSCCVAGGVALSDGWAVSASVDWAAAVCGRQKSAIADADISAARVQLQILDKVNASQDGARPKEGVLPRHVNYRNDEVTERYIVFTRS